MGVLIADVVVADEYILALFVAMLAQVVGGIAWLVRLGARMTRAEDGIRDIQASLDSGSGRMDRLEHQQSAHTTKLAVIEAGVDELRRGVGELKAQQNEVLSILRERR